MLLRELLFLTEVPCQTSCPDLPLPITQANHLLRRCFVQRFCLSCTVHIPTTSLRMYKTTFLLHCVLLEKIMHRILSSMTARSVRTVFPCSLYNLLRAFTSVHFLDTEAVFFCKLFSVTSLSQTTDTVPDEIETLLVSVWVKQSVTRCTDIFLGCRCERCDF